MRGDLRPVAELHDARRAAGLQADDVARGEHLRAELRRLSPGPVGELGAGHTVREAEVVLDAGALPGLATGGLPLDEHGPQTLGRPVDRAAQPGRAAADHDQVVEVGGGGGGEADRRGDLGLRRRLQHRAVRRNQHRDVVGRRARRLEQAGAVGLLDVVPAVRDGVAGQEVAGGERLGRPAVPEHLRLLDGAVADAAPGLDQGVDDRVELLVRRLPRLEQVVVDVDDVDGPDRGVGVGVGGEQRAAGARGDVHRLLEELDAVHAGHPVVGEDGGGGLAAQRQLLEGVERVRPGLGADHPELAPVLPPQITGDGAGDAGVVVDGHQDGSGHQAPSSAGALSTGVVRGGARYGRNLTRRTDISEGARAKAPHGGDDTPLATGARRLSMSSPTVAAEHGVMLAAVAAQGSFRR